VYRHVGVPVQYSQLDFDGEDALGAKLIKGHLRVVIASSLERHQHARHAELTQTTLDR